MAAQIRLATHADIPALAGIERAAGETFRAVGMAEIADDEPLPDDVLLEAGESGLLWVAVEEPVPDVPIAYLLGAKLDDGLHIEQVTVHPLYPGQRIGSRLIDAAEAMARDLGATCLTLTTFRDVPWNAPYYRRLGFSEVPPGDRGPAMRALVEREAAAGLDRWPRVVMRRKIT